MPARNVGILASVQDDSLVRLMLWLMRLMQIALQVSFSTCPLVVSIKRLKKYRQPLYRIRWVCFVLPPTQDINAAHGRASNHPKTLARGAEVAEKYAYYSIIETLRFPLNGWK
jgi:hypothetical protein